MENNDNNNRRAYHIQTCLYTCFYFCPTFYKVYRKLEKAHDIFARFQGLEAIFVCQNCLKIIRQYINEDKSFFLTRLKRYYYSTPYQKKKNLDR